MPDSVQSAFRLTRVLYWFAVTAMVSLPLFLVIAYKAEILTIGSESLAYRFFYSYRILNGERGNIYLPQGYLLSAVQNLMLLLSGAEKADAQSLRWALNFFSITSLAFNTALLAAAVTIASFARGITWPDRLLVAIVALGPIYATSGHGFAQLVARLHTPQCGPCRPWSCLLSGRLAPTRGQPTPDVGRCRGSFCRARDREQNHRGCLRNGVAAGAGHEAE